MPEHIEDLWVHHQTWSKVIKKQNLCRKKKHQYYKKKVNTYSGKDLETILKKVKSLGKRQYRFLKVHHY